MSTDNEYLKYGIYIYNMQYYLVIKQNWVMKFTGKKKWN